MFSENQSPELKKLLQTFQNVGGVIEFKVYDVNEKYLDHDLHQDVAIQFISDFYEVPNPYKGIKRDLMHSETVTDSFFSYVLKKFLSPPYCLSSKNKIDFHQLFTDINLELFGKKIIIKDGKEYVEESGELFSDKVYDDLEIYCWMRDDPEYNWCPKYFDDGLEWWGSFLYTIKLKNGKYIVVSASTTD